MTRPTVLHPTLRGAAAMILGVTSLAACGRGDAGVAAPVDASARAACAATATIDLAAGQTRALSGAEAACMRMAPHGSARYVLAAFDGRGVNSARTGPESAPEGEVAYTIDDGTGASLSDAAPRTLRAAGEAAPAGAPADLAVGEPRRSATADALDPFARTAPWREGETFAVHRVEGSTAATARVARVAGRLVLAVADADADDGGRFARDAARALDYMARDGVPLLDGVYGDRAPSTSEGSGQVLVLLTAWDPDKGTGATRTEASPDGSGVHSYVVVNLNVRGGVRAGFEMYDHPAFRLKVLAHELTHAWQVRYAYETQPAGPRAVGMGPAWAMEGSADLVAVDVVRRFLGVGLTSNWDWSKRLRGGDEYVVLALEPAAQRGMLARGYFDASSFLRDLQVRLVRRGADADQALGEVARGAVEGWWGVDAAGVRRRGLADRMRAGLGAQWDPRDAVLLWTATQAADDLTPSRDLDNAVYSHAGDPGEPYAWRAEYDDMRLGRPFGHRFTYPAASSFFVSVADPGEGGTLAAKSSDPDARWLIARVR